MSEPSPTERQTNPWHPYLLLGVVLFLLGTAALGSTLLDVVSVLIFGPVFLAAGILEVFVAFVFHRGKELWLSLLAAALNMILGFLLLAYPHLGGTEMNLVVAGFLIAFGLVSAGRAYAAGRSRGGWLLVAGLAALLLAACVWLRGPLPGIWFIGVCLGVDLLVYGMTQSASSLTVRASRDSRQPSKPAPQEPVASAPSVEEEGPEPGEAIEQMEERMAEHLKEIDQDLERVDQMIHRAEEKAKNMYKLDQD